MTGALTRLAAIAWLVVAQAVAAQPVMRIDGPITADADPALWAVRDADTTIYLFGTVHILPPGLGWFDEGVERAFRASDELWLETLAGDPEALGAKVAKLARDPDGRTMAARLGPRNHALYARRLKALGLPVAPLEGFEPWFVGLQMASAMLAQAGYDRASGVEPRLEDEARGTGKRIVTFETPEAQIAMMDSTPAAEQLSGLLRIVHESAGAQGEIDGMVKSWAAGDPDTTGRIMNRGFAGAPVTVRILLTDRNRRWADALVQRMGEPGTLFVAVGAGHLAGTDSLLRMLAARGLTVERVAY